MASSDTSDTSADTDPATDAPSAKTLAYEVAILLAIAGTIALILFALSGTWPPFVAVSSGSMEPHMQAGDLVFIVAPDRISSDAAIEGVVTHRIGEAQETTTFGSGGHVIVYRPNGTQHRTPIIHRAQFWVEDGENWFSKANHRYIRADNCAELANCPAPHAGYITKGDANGQYDQAVGYSQPVRPSWVNGIAKVRIPHLGWLSL